MSRRLAVLGAVAAAAVLACRQDPGFDIVRVPESAYLSPDAAPTHFSARPDAGAEAAGPFMLCVEAPLPNDGKPDHDPDDEQSIEPEVETSSDFPDCPEKLGERSLDPRVTQRHRQRDGQEQACCYREKGSKPQPVTSGEGE